MSNPAHSRPHVAVVSSPDFLEHVKSRQRRKLKVTVTANTRIYARSNKVSAEMKTKANVCRVCGDLRTKETLIDWFKSMECEK